MASSASDNQRAPGVKAGSCACGAVTVRIEGAPLCSHLCHCTVCQQLNGAPFAMYVDFKKEQVHLDDPTGALRFYLQLPPPPDSSGPEEDRKQMWGRASCAVCAATVQARNPNLPALTAVPAGVLACEEAEAEAEGEEEEDGAHSPAAARYRALVPPPAVEFWCRRRQGWLGPSGARLVYREQPRDEAGMRECMEAFGLA